jgi:hypothetical protein
MDYGTRRVMVRTSFAKSPDDDDDNSPYCSTVEGKGKVVPVLFFLAEHNTMKAYWEWRYSSTHSLTSALDGGEWSASRTGCFTPMERSLVPIG